MNLILVKQMLCTANPALVLTNSVTRNAFLCSNFAVPILTTLTQKMNFEPKYYIMHEKWLLNKFKIPEIQFLIVHKNPALTISIYVISFQILFRLWQWIHLYSMALRSTTIWFYTNPFLWNMPLYCFM